MDKALEIRVDSLLQWWKLSYGQFSSSLCPHSSTIKTAPCTLHQHANPPPPQVQPPPLFKALDQNNTITQRNKCRHFGTQILTIFALPSLWFHSYNSALRANSSHSYLTGHTRSFLTTKHATNHDTKKKWLKLGKWTKITFFFNLT